MDNALDDLLADDEHSIVEQFEVPAKKPQFLGIPRFLFNSRVGRHLNKQSKLYEQKGKLWSHQARALQSFEDGNNIVVSTSTASGKSLIFRTLAFHKTLLDKNSRVLVFYPLKALIADQLDGWLKMAKEMEVDDNWIGRIDGSVPVRDRSEILKKSHIIMMTPDVCHAWMMSNLADEKVKNFVRGLSILIMDEAHVLESVFGSNFAFLVRRLTAARNALQKDVKKEPTENRLRYIATTATIENPNEHMEKITGESFSTFDHTVDGSPHYERMVVHVECLPGDEFSTAKKIHDGILALDNSGSFITFVDSRKSVEQLAMLTGDRVKPYRAGYDAEDRRHIEDALRSGYLDGVVSTSALELGIDIPHLRIGINIGVPPTRKAYRQRLGRVGRNAPGIFIVIAPRYAFREYGTTLEKYHEMSVEPSYLYLENRFMQFAHARCLVLELESLGVPPKTPSKISWPEDFKELHNAARPGGARPAEFDRIADIGGDNPHYNYPLRNVGEINFKIKVHQDADPMGEINQGQALRECYPGATYLHLAKAYKVNAWYTGTFEPHILVNRTSPKHSTKPYIKTFINAQADQSGIIENHLWENDNGFLAECSMQITETVEGFLTVSDNKRHMYKDMQGTNSNMRAKSRNFRTSGVVLCIQKDWFRRSSVKQGIVERLQNMFMHEYSISLQDVSSAASNIAIRGALGYGLRGGCIVIYDEVHGSLRLTERLYLNFIEMLERLVDALKATSDDDSLLANAELVRDEVLTFRNPNVLPSVNSEILDTNLQVFTPGSKILYCEAGQVNVGAEVIQATIMNEQLMYQVQVSQKIGQQPAKRWISASFVDPSPEADEWTYAPWDPQTETYLQEDEFSSDADV